MGFINFFFSFSLLGCFIFGAYLGFSTFMGCVSNFQCSTGICFEILKSRGEKKKSNERDLVKELDRRGRTCRVKDGWLKERW